MRPDVLWGPISVTVGRYLQFYTYMEMFKANCSEKVSATYLVESQAVWYGDVENRYHYFVLREICHHKDCKTSGCTKVFYY